MDSESLLVFTLVSACFVYAAWTLMPQAARRALSTGLLRLPLPQRWSAYLQKMTQAPAGCQCSGCEHAPPVKRRSSQKVGPTQAQPLVFHPRKK